MADTIQVDYDTLNQISSRFSATHEMTQNIYTTLYNQIQQLRDGTWQGRGANAFYSEMDHLLLPALKRLSECMRSAEYTVKTISAELQTAEEEAQNIINKVMTDETRTGLGAGAGASTESGTGVSKQSGSDSSKGRKDGSINKPSGRTGAELNKTLDGFNVESNQRYKKFRDNNPNTYDTYCNLFAADVAKKMAAPLPLYVTDANGKITKWLGANAMQQWLNGELNVPGSYTQGPANGWSKLSHSDAVNAANEGHLVVVAGHGHMAVVRSGGNPGAGLNNVPIAQAGERNFSSGKLQNGWGQYASEAQFFVFKG